MKKLALNTKKVCLLVLSVMLAVCSILFVASLSNKSVSADETGFYMTTGAQVRLATDEKDDSGIRFQAELSKAKFEEISALSENAIYFGMEIYPAGKPELAKDFCELVDSLEKETESEKSEVYFGEQENFRYVAGITYDMAQLKTDLTNSPAHNENYVPGAEKQVEISEEAFTAYLNKAYGTELTARAYYMVDGDKTYVANPQTRSMWGVATEAYMADDSVWDGDVFLLDKYFGKITTADSRYNVLPNGKIVNSPSFDATKKFYVSAQAVAVENGIVDADVVNALDYGVDYPSYAVDSNGAVSIHTLNKVHNAYQDVALNGGVLADFNEAGYSDSVFLTSGGSCSIIPKQTVEAEGIGNSGILKFDAVEFDSVIVGFYDSFKLSQIDKLYFKIRLNKEVSGSQFRVRLYDTNYERVGDLVDVEVATANKWQLVSLDVSKFTNANADTNIGAIKFNLTHARVAYIDDIGVSKGIWVDPATADSDVYADFDEYEYAFNVSTNYGINELLIGEDAINAGSPSQTGILHAYMPNYTRTYINGFKTFKLSELVSIDATFKFTGPDVSKLRFGLCDTAGNEMLAGDTKTLSDLVGTAGLVNGDWNSISIPVSKLISLLDVLKSGDEGAVDGEDDYVATADTEIASIFFYNGVGSNQTLFVDEVRIGYIFADDSLAYGVIADFDEAGYKKLITYRNEGSFNSMMQDGDRNVLVANMPLSNSYIDIPVPEDMQFSINELKDGVTFKLKTTIGSLTNARLYLFDENGENIPNIGGMTSFANLGVGVTATDYVTITISKAMFEKYWTKDEDKTNLGKKIGQISVYAGATGGTWYFDEVSVSKDFTDTALADGVIADFDEGGYKEIISFANEAKFVEIADGKLVATTSVKNSYIYIEVPDNRTFTINGLTEGITITLKRTGYTLLKETRLYLYKEDGTNVGIISGVYTTFENLGINANATDYVTLTITVDKLKELFTEHDAKVAKLGFYAGVNEEMTWYIHEISAK